MDNLTFNRHRHVDISKLPPTFRNAIRCFEQDNHRLEEPVTLEQALNAYLLWEGIQGYTNEILTFIETVCHGE